RSFSIPDDVAGKTVRCKCGARFVAAAEARAMHGDFDDDRPRPRPRNYPAGKRGTPGWVWALVGLGGALAVSLVGGLGLLAGLSRKAADGGGSSLHRSAERVRSTESPGLDRKEAEFHATEEPSSPVAWGSAASFGSLRVRVEFAGITMYSGHSPGGQ